jgi:hypothetical protein
VGFSGKFSEPPGPRDSPASGHFSPLSAHFLRRNRTTAILVRMSESRQFSGLEDARRGAGLKNLRSGGVNRDRTVRFGVSASGRTADLSLGRLDRLVVDPELPGPWTVTEGVIGRWADPWPPIRHFRCATTLPNGQEKARRARVASFRSPGSPPRPGCADAPRRRSRSGARHSRRRYIRAARASWRSLERRTLRS